MKKYASIGGLVILLAISAIEPGMISADDAIKVLGSRSSANMVDAWAKDFINKNPDCAIVVSPNGSENGIKAFIQGTTDFVMSSRQLRREENQSAVSNGVRPSEYIVGNYGVAIVVNVANPVKELTLDQIRGLFTGQVSSWSQVGGSPEPVDLSMRTTSESGTSTLFQEIVLKGNAFSSTANVFEAFPSVAKRVSSNAGGVAFCNSSRLANLPAGLKVVAMKTNENAPPVLPTKQNVNNGTYPVIAAQYLYVNEATAKKRAGDFAKFCARSASESANSTKND